MGLFADFELWALHRGQKKDRSILKRTAAATRDEEDTARKIADWADMEEHWRHLEKKKAKKAKKAAQAQAAQTAAIATDDDDTPSFT